MHDREYSNMPLTVCSWLLIYFKGVYKPRFGSRNGELPERKDGKSNNASHYNVTTNSNLRKGHFCEKSVGDG